MVRQRRATADTVGTAKVLCFDGDEGGNQLEAISETVQGSMSSDSEAGDIVARNDGDDDSEEETLSAVSRLHPQIMYYGLILPMLYSSCKKDAYAVIEDRGLQYGFTWATR